MPRCRQIQCMEFYGLPLCWGHVVKMDDLDYDRKVRKILGLPPLYKIRKPEGASSGKRKGTCSGYQRKRPEEASSGIERAASKRTKTGASGRKRATARRVVGDQAQGDEDHLRPGRRVSRSKSRKPVLPRKRKARRNKHSVDAKASKDAKNSHGYVRRSPRSGVR